jgi:phosphatidylinositol-3-phosphatase
MSDEKSRSLGSGKCASCGAPTAADQRYCLGCGTRIMPLPLVLSSWLERVRPKPKAERGSGAAATGAAGAAAAAAASAETADAAEEATESGLAGYMPTPQAAAVAVMALLAFGVIIGSVTQQFAQSASAPIVLLSEPTAAPPEPAAAPPEEVVEEVETVGGGGEEAPPREIAGPEPPEEEGGGEKPPAKTPIEIPEPTLPPITHVFLIVLGERGFEETFGPASQSAYFSKTLPDDGELLSNYYAVAGSGLANGVALLSGQGPTTETAANCPEYTDIVPGTASVIAEQVEGKGCVYPASTLTLPGQLVERKLTWKAYVGGIDSATATAAGLSSSCRHPAPGSVDSNNTPQPGDPYTTWSNPIVYFHSIADNPECGERDVGLGQFSSDLKELKRTPTLSYIVPDACHDGSEAPCEQGQPAPGLAGAESFLQTLIPEIQKSQAYGGGGLIAITFSQAMQTGPAADPSSCCATPEYPNLKSPEAPPAEAAPGPVKPSGGGGRVGMVLISPFVSPGSVNETGYYNHFTLLRSIEELFELPGIGYAAEPAVLPFDESVYNNFVGE